jgi:TolA-binding protein
MRTRHVVAFWFCLGTGVAGCATPGQVRRVETQVAAADHDRARADSAQRAELARIQINQRQNIDSINTLVRQLSDAIQRMSRDNASNFDDLRQRLYQVATLANTTVARVNRLSNQVDLAVSSGPPVAAPTDTTGRSGTTTIVPQPEVLIRQAVDAMNQSAYPSARRSSNQLLANYPQSPLVADALYNLGYSFETEAPDSARIYYTRVWTGYPQADKAPTALYKLGNLELKAGNVPAARKYWQQIVKDYRQSLEYESAQSRLRENP